MKQQPPGSFLGQPAITLDEEPVLASTLQKSAVEGLYQAKAPSRMINAGVHALASRSTPPWRVDAALLSQGQPKTFATADLTGFTPITPTEFEGRIDSHGGLLVVTEAYDREWELATVADDFHPTGFALLDWLRLRASAIAANDHYTVDDMLNGWWVPAGRLHLVALFVPQAAVELGILLTLLFVAALVVALRRWPSW